jgi:hypothetical protein
MAEEFLDQKIHRYIFKRWHFFMPQEPPPNSPQKTTNSPRFHHKKPSKKRINMRKPPVKMRNHHAQKNPHQPSSKNWQLGLSPVVVQKKAP